MFVQSTPMMLSISEPYELETVEAIDTKTPYKGHMLKTYRNVMRLYTARGLNVAQFNADNEFTCITDGVIPIHMSIMAAGAHVNKIERTVRPTKEGTRCHVHRLPYKRYPRVMVVECVVKVVQDHNQVPAPQGISQITPPAT